MPDTEARLTEAARRGLGVAGIGTTKEKQQDAIDRAQALGIYAVGIHSTDEEIATWEARLWDDQTPLLEERMREWRQLLLYVANIQYIAYHKAQRRWLVRKAVPWRIRSIYNVMRKAVQIRVARLTENKPSVTVQADTTDREDIEKSEYKEALWWDTWDRLNLLDVIVRARRWASKCCSGFVKVGWDVDAGPARPVTIKRKRYKEKEVPATDLAGQPMQQLGGQPATQTKQVFAGIEELYVNAKGEPLGPVFVEEPDPDDPETMRQVRQPPPEDADMVHDGDLYADVRSPFNIRWDLTVDDLKESWYIQDATIMTGTKILAMFPDKLEELKEARPASDEEKALHWQGLNMQPEQMASSDRTSRVKHGDTATTPTVLEQEYLVRETMIWPENEYLQALWGEKGALLITVGGKLVGRTSLAEWMLEARPVIQFIDTPEEGNHYGVTFLRDLLPLQDDINRTRSAMAENVLLRARLLLWAPQNHTLKMNLLGGLPGTLVTTASPEHQPQVLQMGDVPAGLLNFYQESLAAAADLGNMNEASTGKLPSAGLAAKAIYALQFADERSVQEPSNAQDIALKRLAEAIDAITRQEMTETRKVRVVGRDRAYLVEYDLAPEDLDFSVDYDFVPGSMLARNKEAVRNELIDLRQAGLVDDVTVRKNLATATPDAFRRSYDQQESRARRVLHRLIHNPDDPVQPLPFDNPAVQSAVFVEYLLSTKFELQPENVQGLILQYWQALQVMAQQQAMAAQAAQRPPAGPSGNGGPAPDAPQAVLEQLALEEPGKQMARQAAARVAPPREFVEARP